MMFFGGPNPWAGRERFGQFSSPVMTPGGGSTGAPLQGGTQALPTAQPASPVPFAPSPAPPIPSSVPMWPGATPDAGYATNLANQYAGQLQNQQVPGSVVPTGQFPLNPGGGHIGGPGGQGAVPGWRGAYRSDLMDWRSQRPHGDAGGLLQWAQSRPMARAYRFGGQ